MTGPSDDDESPNKEDSNNNGRVKEEPVVITPDVHPKHKEPIRTQADRSKMRMAGDVEFDAFVTQNEIRTNPGAYIDDVEQQIRKFRNDREMVQDNGVILMTNEGIGAWKEAVEELRKQTRKPKLRALEWNDYLALAA